MLKGTKCEKNLEIQFLRVVAISFVLVCHVFWLLSFIDKHGAHSAILNLFLRLTQQLDFSEGVDVFFVLSGYFMGILVLQRGPSVTDTMAQKVDFTLHFWIKRAKRLFPAAFVWATIGFYFMPDLRSYIASLLNFRDFQYLWNSEHNLGIFWSLSLENQFYFLLPLLAFFLPKKMFWFVILALDILFSCWIPIWAIRPAGLLTGLLVWKILSFPQTKFIIKNKLETNRKIWKIVSIPMVLCFLLVFLFIYRTSITCLVTALVLIPATFNQGFIYIWKWLRPVIYWGGEWSYSLYLCHVPCCLFLASLNAKYELGLKGISAVVVMFLFSVATAALSYFFVERPFYKTRPLKTDLPV